MKRFFKLMSIALLSCSLLTVVSCGDKDDPEDTPNTPGTDTPDPQPDPAIVVKWGGSPATIGYSEAYNYSPGSTVFIAYACKDFVNEEYGWPLFRLGLDLDADPAYGCTLTAQWGYGSTNTAGNSLWPTDVVEEGYYQSDDDLVLGIIGDWCLDEFTDVNGHDYSLTNAQYDPNALTLTASFAFQMFSYTDVIESITQTSTNDEVIAAINASRKKNLEVAINNLSFEAATAKVSGLNKVK